VEGRVGPLGAPHSAQKLAPSANDWPQCTHRRSVMGAIVRHRHAVRHAGVRPRETSYTRAPLPCRVSLGLGQPALGSACRQGHGKNGTLRVFILGSGSSGNCLVVEAEGERLLVDAGLGPTRAIERMRTLGADLVTSRPPVGLFVTHEHGDHAAYAHPLARALRTPIFAHDGVAIDRVRRRVEVLPYVPGRSLVLGPFVVESLSVPHDAPHAAIRVSASGHRMGIATDLGHAPRELRDFLAACDLALLESNYCPRMLAAGPYPPRLRSRVGGPLGHLANEQAADVAASLESTRVARLVLLHLSRANNTPERALEVVGSRLRRLPVEALAHGMPRRFDTAGTYAETLADQLAFGF
jgi:phosphoribosyl 1,2-cyclic phosphodiesterase